MTGLRLAIADPPYHGRAHRWYGPGGRGHGGGRGRADEHPDARAWDDPAQHARLVTTLTEQYDGWAIAATPSSLPTYLAHAPEDHRVLMWHRRNAQPSGARVLSRWEPVVAYIPRARRRYGDGITVSDVLDTPIQAMGFTGAKPDEWTRWVLDVLGHDAERDVVDDLFPGSGAVARVLARALAQPVLL